MKRNSATKQDLYAACLSETLTLAIGILLTAKPDILVSVCKTAGGLVCAAALVLVALYIFKKDNSMLVRGLFAMAAGLVLILLPGLLGFLVPVMFGIWMLLNALSGILRNLSLQKEHRFWWVGVILCGIGAVLGIYTITRPMSTMNATIRLIGIALIAFAVLRLVSVFMARQYFSDEIHSDVIDIHLNKD